ncbi:MFS transporter [Pseudomonas sp. FW215-R2]|uniref:MFS transporter n=1 Tax=unclassified Pseudomonas TaxID=196821 RepID=UPI000C88D411|nr:MULTISPECIES: MFS transporter [unclassified Pseudomonas]PMW96582.1 MFS transporter [Pseudomonas sp. FW215-R2]PMX06010.1 MFS transporter [Pseudomonas sp. FW215-L1]PMX18433.1 MFS transporter [Pseudomonas sp. FW215-E1]PNA22611.1 MFS transporter [Pseudomonas sp. FW215-R4]
MNPGKFLMLAIALLMFPQIAQTLFSPALGDIGRAFDVGPQAAAQTLSVYFLAFAFGVVTWGRVCDRIGRRPSMLAGLAIYAVACVLGLSVRSFNGLLMAQALAAFGAAVGSVVTQTLLRDRYRGSELAQVFSLVGMALAASPAIGLFSGASLVQGFGYRGVLAALLLLASILWIWSWRNLPETRPSQLTSVGLFATMGDMLRDPGIWRSTLWIASFNVALFSYYSLGPFQFERLGLSGEWFGYSGVMLALASGFGAWLNKKLLQIGCRPLQLIRLAALAGLLGGIGVWLLEAHVWFVLPMLLVVLAFGMAIPNILGAALSNYTDRLGTAGALLGLFYYLLIGAGLMLAAWSQALGETLMICNLLALSLAIRAKKAFV